MAQDDATGRLVGVAGLRTLKPGVAEVKRMYAVPRVPGPDESARSSSIAC